MEAVVQYQLPGSEFWDDYRKLWQKSMHPSVFQAPAFIRNLCQYKKSKIAIITFKQENEIVGAAFFQKEKGVFRFISDQKTDHNFFVLHQSCTKEQLKRLFKAFLQTVREENWALALNNMASWADYWEVFQNALKESSLFKVSFSYSVCPVLEAISPEALASKLTKSRNTRYKKNRLQKEWGITFEALTGEEHLEEWITEFANAHEQRWSATNTPSGYRSKDRRAFL